MLVIVLRNLMRFFTKKSFYHQGFFAVKRREVFILGAMWWALVRGWRRDYVVGGMETRFQCRKAHNPSAKCEAFHIAPRLFFMFLFFDSIHDSATMHNLSPEIFHWTKFMSKIFFIIEKMRFFYIFCRFCWIFSFSCVYLWYLFKVNQPANVPTWCHIEGGYRRWKRNTGKIKAFYW